MWTVPTLVWGLRIISHAFLMFFFSLALIFSSHAHADQWLTIDFGGTSQPTPLWFSALHIFFFTFTLLDFQLSFFSSGWLLSCLGFSSLPFFPGNSFQSGNTGNCRLPSSVYVLSGITLLHSMLLSVWKLLCHIICPFLVFKTRWFIWSLVHRGHKQKWNTYFF